MRYVSIVCAFVHWTNLHPALDTLQSARGHSATRIGHSAIRIGLFAVRVGHSAIRIGHSTSDLGILQSVLGTRLSALRMLQSALGTLQSASGTCVSECEHPREKWKYRFYKYERSMEPRPQVLMARRSPPFPRYAMLFRAGRSPTTLPRRMPKLSTLNLGRGGTHSKT